MSEALNIRLGVVGGGSMGGAVARGLVASGTLAPSSVTVADPSEKARAAFEAEGVLAVADAQQILDAGADVLLLAVKPQVLPGVLASIGASCAGLLVVSIAAGVKIATLEEALPGARVVRVMPNLPAQVRSGAAAVTPGTAATPEDAELVRRLFSALGAAEVMSEAQLDVAGAVSGTAPALFALFVDTLTRAGVRAGLPAASCRSMAEATMRGTAEQLLREGVHPRAYMERVTSPGGTTACALKAIEGALLEGSYAAVDAALARTRELAGE